MLLFCFALLFICCIQSQLCFSSGSRCTVTRLSHASVQFRAALDTLHTAMPCTQNPAIHKVTIGDIHGVIASDGVGIFEDSLFLVPDEVLRKSYRECNRPSFPFIVNQNIAVLDTPTGRFMVDTGSFNTGFPQYRLAGYLTANLKAVGISPESIDAVLLTHAHIDHVSGLRTVNGTAAFPNADIYIGKLEHEFWSAKNVPNPNPNIPRELIDTISNIYLRSIAPYKGRLHLVPENGSPLPGIKFVRAYGHSPGHNAIQVTSKRESLLIAADACGGKPDQIRNPEWAFLLETDQKDALKSRLRLMRKAEKNRYLVLAYHEEFPGLGHISKSGGGYDWVPATIQLMGTGVKKLF